MLTSHPLPLGEPRVFDVSAEDGRRRRSESGLGVVILGGLAILVGSGAAASAIGALDGSWIVLGVGTVMLVLGAVFARALYRASKVRVELMEVDSVGVSIRLSTGASWEARWSDPKLRLVLMDYRGDTGTSNPRLREIPCAVLTPQFNIGVPVEALGAIRDAAIRNGVAVVQRAPDQGVAATIVGPGPEIGVVFTRRASPG